MTWLSCKGPFRGLSRPSNENNEAYPNEAHLRRQPDGQSGHLRASARLWSRPCVASGHEFAHVHPHGTQGLLHPTALRVSDVKHHENVENPEAAGRSRRIFSFSALDLGEPTCTPSTTTRSSSHRSRWLRRLSGGPRPAATTARAR